jgi:hypothetical protein
VGLLDLVYSLIEEVSTYYTRFILEEYVYTWEGCRKERLYSDLRREMDFSLHKSSITYLRPMLPPGGRNWQQISPQWMKYFVLQLNNKTQHFKVEKLAQTTFR